MTTKSQSTTTKLEASEPTLEPCAPCVNCWHANPHNGPAGAIDDACTYNGCNCGYYTPASQAAQSWHQWLDRLGAAATIEVVNATATLVIEERALYESAQRNDAATSMRDKCVDAIKSLRATPHGAAYNNAVNDAIRKCESLTLEPLEPGGVD